MKKLKVGVIGLSMGRMHVMGYREHPACEVVAAANPSPGRRESVGKELSIPRLYDSAKAMLERESLDVVSIAAPNRFHLPFALEAFARGCHVLCEKPMAMDARGARRMLEASVKARRRLMINFSFRFAKASMFLKREVDRGALGEVYFGRSVWHRSRGIPGLGGWFTRKRMSGGGPLIDLGVHRLDLALWLMGHPRPVSVLASTHGLLSRRLAGGARKSFDVEDLGAGLIRFANGASLVLEASWASNIREKEMMETRLFGTRGGLVQRNVGEGYDFEAELDTVVGGKVRSRRFAPKRTWGRSPMHHFIDSIVRGRPHMADGREGLVVMEIMDALYASARSGRLVRL